MYEKITKDDFPYIARAIGAGNYVRQCYEAALSSYHSLLPDLYAECIATGWEEYARGGDGDAVFRAAVRAGRRLIWNEIKIFKYDVPQYKKTQEISILQTARIIYHAGKGKISISSAVRKAYIVQQRLMGRSFASIARELN